MDKGMAAQKQKGMLSRLKEIVVHRDSKDKEATLAQTEEISSPKGQRMLLELEGISVHYGVVVALDNVSLCLDDGEIVAVMGPNGAGKSTVLRAIMGLAPVLSGTVYWQQKPLKAATHAMVHLGISFVPQGRRVFTHLTIEENLEMGCLYLKDDAEKKRRVDAVMELFPILHEKRRHLASQMSGGQQQMLAVGRGLMANPEVLLLDEPTLGLAPIVVKEMFEKIVEINQKLGTSIFVVEHNIKSTLNIVSRAYVLDKGKLVHDGTPKSVRDSDILTKVFLGKA
ncbi:MAG: ABC transporter ATP-binding protein [Dehalococcoidia bacterium]